MSRRYGRLAGLGAVVTVLVVVAVVGVTVWREPNRGVGQGAGRTQSAWTCSMHPQVRRDSPGECPICGMDLVAATRVLQGEQATGPANVPGVETATVSLRELTREIRTVGKVNYNERRIADITARIAGRVERLYADFTGIQVKEGDHLVEIYSPQLYQAQNELVLALAAYEKSRAAGQEMAMRTVESSRARLRLWGITQQQLAELERTRRPSTYLTIFAPMGGTVIEKSVRAGQYVREGDLMYRLADLDPIWLYLDIYEYDMGWVRYGQAVDVTLEAFPGETFRGTVTFIEPFLDDKTRTVKVRVNLANPDKRLKPAMYASAVIRVRLTSTGGPEATGLEGKYWCPMHPEVVSDAPGRCAICRMPLERVPQLSAMPESGHAGHGPAQVVAAQGKVLSVAVSAVLDTGRRRVVYRAVEGGFELVDVEVGARAEARDESGKLSGYYPVFTGLKEGDLVVLRGAFLLDSQRQIEGLPSLLYPDGQSAAALHAGHGGMAVPDRKAPAPGGHRH